MGIHQTARDRFLTCLQIDRHVQVFSDQDLCQVVCADDRKTDALRSVYVCEKGAGWADGSAMWVAKLSPWCALPWMKTPSGKCRHMPPGDFDRTIDHAPLQRRTGCWLSLLPA
jgi:hypothetical protein